MDSHQESLAALQHLRSVSNTAATAGDIGVYITASAFEAILHLNSSTQDSIEQAQRAIASARTYQLQMPSTELSQIWALLDVVDLACSLQQCQSPDQADAKMKVMQALLDEGNPQSGWNTNGSFTVALNHVPEENLISDTGGIYNIAHDGLVGLSFSWLPQRDLYLLGYYLSGITAMRSRHITDKAINYLREGLRMTQGELQEPR